MSSLRFKTAVILISVGLTVAACTPEPTGVEAFTSAAVTLADYERAERARQEMVDLAEALVPQFQGLADQMQEKLDDLNIQD